MGRGLLIILLFCYSCKTTDNLVVENITNVKVKEESNAIYIGVFSKIPLQCKHNLLKDQLVVMFPNIRSIEGIEQKASEDIGKISYEGNRNASHLIVQLKKSIESVKVVDRSYGCLIVLNKKPSETPKEETPPMTTTSTTGKIEQPVPKEEPALIVEKERFSPDLLKEEARPVEDDIERQLASEVPSIDKTIPDIVEEKPTVIVISKPKPKPKPKAPSFNFELLPKTPISIAVSDTNLVEVLKVLSISENVEIKLAPKLINKKITINYQNIPWNKILQELVKENRLQISMKDRVLFIK